MNMGAWRVPIMLVLMCLICATGRTADESKYKIILPTLPNPPAPQPGAVMRLTGDQLYIVQSDTPCVVLCSPIGGLRITTETGPLRIRSKFVDGTGTETRTYTDKYLWVVEAATTGTYELLVIPQGAVGDKDVVRRMLDVDTGTGPRPPPDPKPPEPKPPEPKPPDTLTSFRVFLIMESADKLTAEQRGIVYGKVVEDWLNTNCTGGNAGWRRRDKDTTGENDKPMAPLWAAIQPQITTTPCIAIERNGKVDILPLDATPSAQVETLKKYRGK